MSLRISTLPNGLRVVSDAMPQVKTVSVGIWVDAGARDETPEINGVAHMLEHMAFKGTRRRSALAIAEEIEAVGGDWPGRGHGLSARQAEIVSLITQGLSNNDIAERTYLSPNTVKSYIREAYRHMGVSSRTQAVLWGIDHGMAPTRMRVLLSQADDALAVGSSSDA